jgi:hypothetical protein
MYGIAVCICMHTVIETPAFLASAADERIGEDEREAIVSYMAANPDAGDVMPGTGGARKVRFAGRGKGKSGGNRVITFYAPSTRQTISRYFCSTFMARTHKPTCRRRNAMN